MWPLGWLHWVVASALGKVGILLPSSLSQESFLRGLGWPRYSVWLCWSLVGLWTTPQSDTLVGWQAAKHVLTTSQSQTTRPETSLCHALSPFMPDAVGWAVSGPQMILSNGKPPKSSPHCSPSGALPTCCLKCTPLNVPSKMVPSGPPKRGFSQLLPAGDSLCDLPTLQP